MSDRWPAMMRRETAAEYCDMTAEQFDRQCPVAPVDQGWRGLRWKRAKLDAWIEQLPEKPRQKTAPDKIGLDGPNFANANEEGSGTNAAPANDAEAAAVRRAAALDRFN